MINKRLILLVALMAVMLAAIVPAYRGIDFGHHWDEPRLLDSACESIESGILLPRWYSYPSLSYDLVAICAVPKMGIIMVDEFGRKGPDNTTRIKAIKMRLLDYVHSTDYKLLVRAIFIVLTYLAVIWIGLLVYRWRGSIPEAVIAAGILAGSWELNYHSRWIAPDGILMQFGVLSLMFLMHGIRNEARKGFWIKLAAVTAGLACGTKYTGGIFLIPVLASLFMWPDIMPQINSKQAIKSVFIILACFTVAFVITTPGALLEPVRFVRHVSWEMSHYGRGHYGHSINAGFEHAYLLFVYLSQVSLSANSIIALVWCGFAVIGTWSAYKDDKKEAILILMVPLVYFVYMSIQKVMIVRNYLLLLPFMAVFAARGIALIYETSSRRWKWLGVAVYVLVFIMFVINIRGLISTSETIRNRHNVSQKDEVLNYIRSHIKQGFVLSAEAREQLLIDQKEFICPDARKTNYVFMARWWGAGLANRKGRYQLISGSREVNFDYYPDWAGDVRVVAMDYKDALLAGMITDGK